MDFLAICQRAARECGVTQSQDVPDEVTGQVGDLMRIVDWVASSWDELQNRYPDWRWMRSRWTLNTVAGTDAYAGTDATDTLESAAVDRFAHWIPTDDRGLSNVRIYKQSDGIGTERYLPFLPWSDFRSLYGIGQQNNGVPAHCTIDPQDNIVVGPPPDDVYVMSGEYQRSAISLTDDGDIPDMPTRYHLLLVYMTMQKYGGYEAAVEVFNRGHLEAETLLRALEISQRPAMMLGEPLA